MFDNVGLRYPHRASGAKAPRTLRPLPLLRFAVSATGGAHLCSIQYYLRFWLSSCRTSLAVSALRIMRYCPIIIKTQKQYNSHNGQARCGCCFWCPFSRGKKSVPIYFDCIVDTAIIMPQPGIRFAPKSAVPGCGDILLLISIRGRWGPAFRRRNRSARCRWPPPRCCRPCGPWQQWRARRGFRTRQTGAPCFPPRSQSPPAHR